MSTRTPISASSNITTDKTIRLPDKAPVQQNNRFKAITMVHRRACLTGKSALLENSSSSCSAVHFWTIQMAAMLPTVMTSPRP